MKRWKRIIAGMLSLVFFMTSVRISFLEKAHAQGTERTIVSRVVTGENGKSYVEVDGKPFMYENVECMGTWQLRGFDKNSVTGYEDPLPMEWLENVFEKTAYAGYNTVSTLYGANRTLARKLQREVRLQRRLFMQGQTKEIILRSQLSSR